MKYVSKAGDFLRKIIGRKIVNKLAGDEGFEPSLTGPEPAVLPLD
jgi:hypothetical protein